MKTPTKDFYITLYSFYIETFLYLFRNGCEYYNVDTLKFRRMCNIELYRHMLKVNIPFSLPVLQCLPVF